MPFSPPETDQSAGRQTGLPDAFYQFQGAANRRGSITTGRGVTCNDAPASLFGSVDRIAGVPGSPYNENEEVVLSEIRKINADNEVNKCLIKD
jgi:hypothetical protein